MFADPALVAGTGTAARTLDTGHGRPERRWPWSSPALVGYSDWPGLAQALCLERGVTRRNTGEVRRERVSAVTSLPRAHGHAAIAATRRAVAHHADAALTLLGP